MNEKLLEYFSGDELAANVWLSKYAMDGEGTPDGMHRRMAKEFARIERGYQEKERSYDKGLPLYTMEEKSRLSTYGSNREGLTEVSIYNLFKDFKYIVPQGSIMYGLGRGNPVSLSNCFVIDSAKDSYGGIMLTDQEQAQLMKRRGGVGHDLSLLRPKGTKVHNSAKSSTGMSSFMHRFSNTTREVAQDGRRGALMLSIDGKHPDVMDFIKIKRDGTSVTGANISIRLNSEFMKAVENDEDYILRFPCDVKTSLVEWSNIEYNKLITFSDHNGGVNYYVKKIKAKEYWDEIIKSARNHAEPGLMYWDNVLDNDPAGVYKQYKPISSNPCGEQFLQAYDSCRLMAINLFSFVDNPFTDESEINFKKLYEVSYEQQRLADDLVDLEIEYIDRILDKIILEDEEPDTTKRVELELWKKIQTTAEEGRRTGCGITALGDMLAALNLKYDSDEALRITDLVMKTKMKAELDCNIDLAILRGSFEGWNLNQEFDNYQEVDIEPTKGNNSFYQFLLDKFPEQAGKMINYGRRNVSWSTIAPTGSVSILTQTTSGCEPIFQPFYMRRKKINPNDEGSRVDFVDESGDSWQEFPVLHSKFKEWIEIKWQEVGLPYSEDPEFEKAEMLDKTDLQKAFEESPWYGATANDIDWQRRNEIQAILQKYTTNAISSTINLPSTVTEQEVSDIYLSGWKLGLKGQTVYVDGSRSGVLVDSNKKEEIITFHDNHAPTRPKSVDAKLIRFNNNKEKWIAFVGLLDNKPYEIFTGLLDEIKIPHKIEEGKIVKRKDVNGVKSYYFEYEGGEEEIGKVFNKDFWNYGKLVSGILRHGMPLPYAVELISNLKFVEDHINTWKNGVARTLKKFIPDGKAEGMKCQDCGSTDVVFEEGCSKCLSCGSSKCG